MSTAKHMPGQNEQAIAKDLALYMEENVDLFMHWLEVPQAYHQAEVFSVLNKLTAAPAMYEAGLPVIREENLIEVSDDGSGDCYVVKLTRQEYQTLRQALAQAEGK